MYLFTVFTLLVYAGAYAEGGQSKETFIFKMFCIPVYFFYTFTVHRSLYKRMNSFFSSLIGYFIALLLAQSTTRIIFGIIIKILLVNK